MRQNNESMNYNDLDDDAYSANNSMRFWVIAVLVLQPMGYVFFDFPQFLAGQYVEGGIATVAKVLMIVGGFQLLKMQARGLMLYLIGKVVKFLGILYPLVFNWEDKILEIELALIEQNVEISMSVASLILIGVSMIFVCMSIFPVIFLVNRKKFEDN